MFFVLKELHASRRRRRCSLNSLPPSLLVSPLPATHPATRQVSARGRHAALTVLLTPLRLSPGPPVPCPACCSAPQVFAGLLVGAMLPYWFSAMTMKSVGKAALAMVEEVRRAGCARAMHEFDNGRGI